MTGGAGAISDMISRVRNNRNLQKRPRGRYFDERKKDKRSHTKTPYLDKEATPEHLEEIRVELTKQKKKSRTTSILVLIVSLVITGIVVKLLVFDILLYYFTSLR